MPASLSRVFNALNNNSYNNFSRHLPMLNELSATLDNYFGAYNQLRRKKSLVNWYRRIPELTGMINKVANDSTSRFHFETVNPSESGRNKILRANRFAQEVSLKKTNNATFVDALVTGDGFGWMGFLKNEDVMNTVKSMVFKNDKLEFKQKADLFNELMNEIRLRSLNFERKQVEGIIDTSGIDEDLLRPRKYRYLPSSTVEILYDLYDVKGYAQVVGLNEEKFSTKEIIHYMLMERDGKPNGFTPVESILVQLELLRFMWMNMYAIHKNGGHPDKIISLENVNPNSNAYQRIEEQLAKYKLVENKHGLMLFTGKVGVEDLMQLDAMQFKDMGLYITGVIAMQWGLPRSSIPFIVGGSNTKDDTGGNSERGYWEVVKNLQETFAETQNTQLWIPHFGVKIVFENPYLQLDIQLEQAQMTKLQNILSMDTILMKDGLQLNKEKRLRLLGLTEEDTTEVNMEFNMPMNAAGMGTDAQQPNDAGESDSKKNVKKTKKEEQTRTMASRGVPTGYGKQTSFNPVETKTQKVNFPTFMKIWNEEMMISPAKPPRILRKDELGVTYFTFKGEDFDYLTVIPSNELNKHEVSLMNVSNHIVDSE